MFVPYDGGQRSGLSCHGHSSRPTSERVVEAVGSEAASVAEEQAVSRNVYTLDLSPRPNVHQRESPFRDVLEICAVGLLALLGYIIVCLVLT